MTGDALDEVARLLRDHGVDAHRRDWALGRTVVAPGGVRSEQSGIVVSERVVWVVGDVGCSVYHADHGTLARRLTPPDAARVALAAVGEGWSVLQKAALQVRIVERLSVRGRGYVVVQMPDKERELRVEHESALDGCLLEPWLEQPRALASDGQQMRSRFVVVLRDAVDLAWFAPGQMRVFLSGTARSAAGIADL